MSKSDKPAKNAYAAYLEGKGYSEVGLYGSSADLSAKKNGEEYYFEIKMTEKTDKYFGAATETEWAKAVEADDKYRFVIVQQLEGKFRFLELTRAELMRVATIPPFKINFNLDLNEKEFENRWSEYEPDRAENVELNHNSNSVHEKRNPIVLKNDREDKIFKDLHKAYNIARKNIKKNSEK